MRPAVLFVALFPWVPMSFKFMDKNASRPGKCHGTWYCVTVSSDPNKLCTSSEPALFPIILPTSMRGLRVVHDERGVIRHGFAVQPTLLTCFQYTSPCSTIAIIHIIIIFSSDPDCNNRNNAIPESSRKFYDEIREELLLRPGASSASDSSVWWPTYLITALAGIW